MPTPVRTADDLRPGEIYEDCFYHPCVCISVEELEVSGISLIDGSQPRGCSIGVCGVRKLTVEEAWTWKTSGPQGLLEGTEIPETLRWW